MPPRKKDKKAIGVSSDGQIQKQGDFNRVGKNPNPNAWRVQEESNLAKLDIQVVRAEQDEQKAICVVRASTKDGFFVEDVVIHHFRTVFENMALDALVEDIERVESGKEPLIFGDPDNPFDKDANPIMTQKGMVRMIRKMARFKTFAIRDAQSKAGRRAELKALNYDWRKPEELGYEQQEINQVEESKQERRENIEPDKETKELLKKAQTEANTNSIDHKELEKDVNQIMKDEIDTEPPEKANNEGTELREEELEEKATENKPDEPIPEENITESEGGKPSRKSDAEKKRTQRQRKRKRRTK